MMLAMALLALLTSLSVPRMRAHSQRALLLQAQAQLVALAGDVASWRSLYNRSEQQIRAALPAGLYSDAGDLLYTLSYQAGDDGDWSLVASPQKGDRGAQIVLSAEGRCSVAEADGGQRAC